MPWVLYVHPACVGGGGDKRSQEKIDAALLVTKSETGQCSGRKFQDEAMPRAEAQETQDGEDTDDLA